LTAAPGIAPIVRMIQQHNHSPPPHPMFEDVRGPNDCGDAKCPRSPDRRRSSSYFRIHPRRRVFLVAGSFGRVSNRVLILAVTSAMVATLLSACTSAPATLTNTQTHATTTTSALPPGVMSAEEACHIVVGRRQQSGFFTDVERVHLVLTTYAKGEPVESGGDISHGMPPDTLVWVVEVHAKSVNWNHSEPAPPPNEPPTTTPPATDFSVVMNAQTGGGTDSGECRCWPLPLSTVGTVVSLPPDC
jgi:hypothetical protein